MHLCINLINYISDISELQWTTLNFDHSAEDRGLFNGQFKFIGTWVPILFLLCSSGMTLNWLLISVVMLIDDMVISISNDWQDQCQGNIKVNQSTVILSCFCINVMLQCLIYLLPSVFCVGGVAAMLLMTVFTWSTDVVLSLDWGTLVKFTNLIIHSFSKLDSASVYFSWHDDVIDRMNCHQSPWLLLSLIICLYTYPALHSWRGNQTQRPSQNTDESVDD